MVMMGSFMEPRMNPEDPTPAEILMGNMSPQQREMFQRNEETRRKYMSIMKSGQREGARQLTAQEMFLKYEYEQTGVNKVNEDVSRGNRQLFTSASTPFISVPKYRQTQAPIVPKPTPSTSFQPKASPEKRNLPEIGNADFHKASLPLPTPIGKTNLEASVPGSLNKLKTQKRKDQEKEPLEESIRNKTTHEIINQEQGPLMIYYRDSNLDSVVSDDQDQRGQATITIDLTTSEVTPNTKPIEELTNGQKFPQLQDENKEESEVYYKEVEEEPVYYYKDFPTESPNGSLLEGEDFNDTPSPNNNNQVASDSNSQFVITTKSAGEVKLSDQLLSENPNNILKNLDFNPPDPFVFQPIDLTSPNNKIKKVRKIKVDKDGNRIEVDPIAAQNEKSDGNLVKTLTSDNQLNVFEFELQGDEDDTGVIQTIEIEGPVDYEFNYVVDLINSGFFSQEEAQALGGNVQGNFQVQDGAKTQEVDYSVTPKSGFAADAFWELNSK